MSTGASLLTLPKKRYEYLDFSRGIIMALMALDHCSSFWNVHRVAYEGLRGYFPDYLNTPQMLTRVVTHFVPTMFIWISGFFLALFITRRIDKGSLESAVSRDIAIRGLILILLHLTIVNLGFQIRDYLELDWKGMLSLQVLWTIGMNMILLAWLRRISIYVLTLITFICLFVYPFYYDTFLGFTHSNPFIYALGIVTFAPTTTPDVPLYCIYPIIPWTGVMLFGYLFGLWFQKVKNTISQGLMIGLYLILSLLNGTAFYILRSANDYGNLLNWEIHNFEQFITLSKYPPSLAYLFFTFACMFLLLAVSLRMEQLKMFHNSFSRFIITIGQVPLFFYCIHILFYGPLPVFLGIDRQFGLPAVYLVWIVVLVILYFPCKWYLKYKKTHPRSLARYL